MSLQTAHDIPFQVTSENASSERRISPSWTLAQLKTKLELVTGIPASSQQLSLCLKDHQTIPMTATDEDSTQLSNFPLAAYAEIHVDDTRPRSQRTNYTDVSQIPKYTMPADAYALKSDSVLAWKKAHKLGRFDPSAPSTEAAKLATKLSAYETERRDRGIEVGKRCRVGGEDSRRGEVMYVGDVDEIPGEAGRGVWVGVKLDEPVGKNDGSVGGRRYWGKDGEGKYGVFVRPERVEMGEWPALDCSEDFEEI